jgi:hypothetical protein
MLRMTIVCLLIGGAATGCASLGRPSAGNYSLTDGGGECSQLEGSGDCQPSRTSVANAPVLSAGSPVDRNRKQ